MNFGEALRQGKTNDVTKDRQNKRDEVGVGCVATHSTQLYSGHYTLAKAADSLLVKTYILTYSYTASVTELQRFCDEVH
jgi:hypothetical protein